MPRAQRREQILGAATRAFARAGFANTGLDVIGAETGVTPVILYRHFASKADLYRAADPAAFRLLFRYAPREPEFRDVVDTYRSTATEIAHRNLADITDDRWRSWAAELLPTLTTDAVIAWLDAGQPDPDQAAVRIRRIVDAVISAAHTS
jgi:AcrR family transcriptional regulator